MYAVLLLNELPDAAVKVPLVCHLFACLCSRSVMSDSVTPWTGALQPWDSPGENAGVGCHALLQGIFLTHDPCLFCLLQRQAASLPPRPRKPHVTRGSARTSALRCQFSAPFPSPAVPTSPFGTSIPVGIPFRPSHRKESNSLLRAKASQPRPS